MKGQFKKIRTICSIIILTVFLFNSLEVSQLVNARTITLTAPTSVKAVSYSYNSTYISWKAVTGATGYAIYRATSSSGTYKSIATTTAKAYKNTSLITGQTYYYKIKAYKTSGKTKIYSQYSSKSSAKPTLALPTSVKASRASYNSISISWGGVAGAGGYNIYRANSINGSYSLLRSTTLRSYVDTGLTTGNTYYYKIKAYRTTAGRNVYSSYSSVASSKPALSTPTGIKASVASYNSATVTWDGVTGASGYELYRSTSSSGTYSLVTATTAKSYKNTGLTTGVTYFYKIRAYRTVGSSKVYSSYSPVVSSKPVLPIPTGVKASVAAYNSVTVAWAGVTGASGYELYRSTSSSGTYTLVTATTAKSYKNTGLTSGTTYYYKVRAYTTVGSSKVYSSYSSIVSSKPILPIPTGVKAAAAAYNNVTVTWGTVAEASGYELYRSESSSGTYTLVSTTTSGSYEDTSVTTGTTYYYKVRAFVTAGNSKVYSSYSSVVNAKPIIVVPALAADISSSGEGIDITWDYVAGVSGYMLYRATSSTGTYTKISDSNLTGYTDTGLTAGTTYYYKVRAYVTNGGSTIYSSYSNVESRTFGGINVTGVSLNKSTDTINYGHTDTLTATITPADAVNKSVTWKSSDTSVVTVDSNGKLTPVGRGTATVTVTTADGDYTADCSITVTDVGIRGIDVSKWQGTIKWASVKSAGVKFAMIRSSYGSSNVDPMFNTNYSGAKANGIAVGAYHYSYATSVSKATAEVNFFMKQLNGKQFEYPVCVDMEDASLSGLSKTTLTDIVLVYLEKLTQAGYYPMIYANKTWFTSKLDATRLAPYDHWLAQWASSMTYTGAVGMWQYSDAGSVSGISGRVDMDISYVDYTSKIKAAHKNGF